MERYIPIRESGWLYRNPKPNTNRKELKIETFWLRFVFESYFEVDDDVWGERGCISEDYDSFVSDSIVLRGW